jgi:hypothetical protein
MGSLALIGNYILDSVGCDGAPGRGIDFVLLRKFRTRRGIGEV